MAKEDTKQAQVAVTRATVTVTRDTSEPGTHTEPQAEAPSVEADRPQAAEEAADPMVAWFEASIAQVQYSSPEWQWLTAGLLHYQGLQANG